MEYGAEARGISDRRAAEDYVGEDNAAMKSVVSLENFALCSVKIVRNVEWQELDIANCRLDFIPPGLVNLDFLVDLNLSNNQLLMLPLEIGQLSSLKILNLSNNSKLERLPVTLVNCPLTSIDVSDCTELDPVVRKAASKSIKELKALFNEMLHGKPERPREFRLMICGQENVGKTTLLKALGQYTQGKKIWKELVKSQSKQLSRRASGSSLRSSDCTPATPQPFNPSSISTDGIDIGRLDFGCGKKMITFRSWDFAGQEVYYATHQFFLSSRAVYVVVWDMRKPLAESRVHFWLGSIISRAGGKAPILLVGTHLDGLNKSPSEVKKILDGHFVRLKKAFPNLMSATAVSLMDMAGVDDFGRLLVNVTNTWQENLRPVPRSFILLESAICDERKRIADPPTLQMDDIYQMANQLGIDDNAQVEKAISYLHDQGTVVHFGAHQNDLLADLVVVDPSWLTECMATLITTKPNMVSTGIIAHADLPLIWRPPKYPIELHSTLLALLQCFDIIFPLFGDDSEANDSHFGLRHADHSLIPCLLPEDVPAATFRRVWSEKAFEQDDILFDCRNDLSKDKSHSVDEITMLGRRYVFDFVPHGLFSRLMVRLLHLIPVASCFWRYGVVLVRGFTKAFVEFDAEKGEVTFTIRGPTTDAIKFLHMSLSLMSTLTSFWYKLTMNSFALCPACFEKKRKNVNSWKMKELEIYAAEGKPVATCADGHTVDVATIAPDVCLTDLKECQFQHSDIKFEKKLAEGGYGRVFRAVLNSKYVAVKELLFATNAVEQLQQFSSFRHEVHLMAQLHHPNIVNMKGYTLKPFTIVMEYIRGGDLHQFLHKEDVDIDWESRLRITADICRGMVFLHSQNPPVLHRDLKSPNVLLAEKQKRIIAKVADFGLSSPMYVNALKEVGPRQVQNPTWLAPEIIRKQPYSTKSDVYAFGIVCWEIATRGFPFTGYKFTFQVDDAIVSGERPPWPNDPDIPLSFKQMTEAAWAHNSEDRPSFRELAKWLRYIRAGKSFNPKRKGKVPRRNSQPEPANHTRSLEMAQRVALASGSSRTQQPRAFSHSPSGDTSLPSFGRGGSDTTLPVSGGSGGSGRGNLKRLASVPTVKIEEISDSEAVSPTAGSESSQWSGCRSPSRSRSSSIDLRAALAAKEQEDLQDCKRSQSAQPTLIGVARRLEASLGDEQLSSSVPNSRVGPLRAAANRKRFDSSEK